jgi:GDPmannose 4,6-dehydratase
MSKISLVFGSTGQSGSWLCEELLNRNYNVIGVRRRNATSSTWRLDSCIPNKNFELVYGDVTDCSSIFSLFNKYRPNFIYNAAASSHVAISFEQPLTTWKITAEGHLNVLEGVRQICPQSRLIFFASSEMFGNNYTEYVNGDRYQNENTPLNPASPYSIAKVAAYNATRLYRECYNLNCISGIMFNKESNRRSINFVTRKITSYFYNLKKYGFKEKLKLGNLNSFRDWSSSPEVMTGLVNLTETDLKDDYIFASGETHTIQEFLEEVSKYYGVDWQEYIEIDKSLFRPSEVNYLRGDATKIYNAIKWRANIKFKELVQILCEKENGLS